VGRGPLRRLEDAYSPTVRQPLAGYMVACGAYLSFVGAASLLALRRAPKPIPVPSAADVVLLAIATHKASRLVAKDAVTSFLRAPLTRFERPAGDAEVQENVRTKGELRALGEVLSCPFCLDVWFGTLSAFGLLFAPVFTRWAASVLSAAAGADYLNLVYNTFKRFA
jgi:hypothetical protein